MNRRAFLVSVAAVLTLDPERALWVPGKKLISVPAPRPLPYRYAWIVSDGMNYTLTGKLICEAGKPFPLSLALRIATPHLP